MPTGEMMNLKTVEVKILRHLLTGESYVYAISRRLKQDHSSVHRAVVSMEKLGWLSSRWIKPPYAISRRPIRLFQLTDIGREVLLDWEIRT